MINILDEAIIAPNPFTRLNIFCTAQPRHCHTFFEFVVVTDGHCKHMLNDRAGELLYKGTMVILRTCDNHKIDFANRSCKYRDFYVTQDKMMKICALLGDNFFNQLMNEEMPLQFSLSVDEFNTIEKKAAFIEQTNLNELGSSEQLGQIHTSIIIELLSKYIENNINANSSMPEWLNQLYLRLTYFDYIDLTLSEIIEKTGYSHGYICQMFKKYFKTTLLGYHNRNKIIYSCQYLNKMKIIDVASMLGWENPKNYSTEFRKVFNMSPREYINGHKLPKKKKSTED